MTDSNADKVQEEFEAYKAKTKEWQAKVKERDVKMRSQLSSITQEAREKDDIIVELQKKQRDLETKLLEIPDLHAKLRAAEESQEDAIREGLEAAKVSIAAELDTFKRDVLALRGRNNDLMSTNSTLRSEIDGSAIYLAAAKDADELQCVESKYLHCARRVAVGGTLYCFLRNKMSKKEGWIREQSIADKAFFDDVVSSALTDDEATQERVAEVQRAVEEQMEQKWTSKLEEEIAASKTTLATQETKTHETISSLQKQVASLQAEIVQLGDTHATAQASRQAEHEAVVNELKQEMSEAKHAAREQLEARFKTELAGLQEKVKALEEYKARAQVALKTASGRKEMKSVACETNHTTTETATDDDVSKERGELQAQVAELNRLLKVQRDDFELRIRNAESDHSAELENLRVEIAASQRTVSADPTHEKPAAPQRVSVAQQVDLGAPTTPTPKPEDHRTVPVVVHSRSQELKELLLAQPKPTRPSEVPKGSNGGHGGNGISDGLDFGELLSAEDHDNSTHNSGLGQLLIAQLRSELAEAYHELDILRAEVRDLSIGDEHHREQLQVLKEQLREADRSRSRAQLVQGQGDYLKNVVFKFLEAKDNKEMQKSLVPIISTILQLSSTETERLAKVVN